MIWIAVIVIYALVWYKSTIYLASVYNENHEKEFPSLGLREHNKKDNLMGAMFANLIWPIWIPLHFLTRHMSGKIPPTTKELQKQIENQHRQIKELEEMLGIG